MNHRLPGIDVLRGIAILLVLFSHSSYNQRGLRIGIPFNDLADMGKHGVTLFFLVSGFTIFRAASLRSETGWEFFRAFFIRRVFRILPAWFFVLLFFYVPFNPGNWQQTWANLSLATAIFPSWGGHYFAGQLSVYIEEHFYFLFPFLFRAFFSFKFTGCVLVLLYLLKLLKSSQLQTLGMGNVGPFLLQAYIFIAGIFCFHLSQIPKLQIFLSGRKGQRWLYLILISSCLLLYLFKWEECAVVASGALMFLVLQSDEKKERNFLFRFLVLMGTYSYSIYLVHISVFRVVRLSLTKLTKTLFLQTLSFEVNALIFLLVCTAICFPLGALLYKHIEKPFIDMGSVINQKLRSFKLAVT